MPTDYEFERSAPPKSAKHPTAWVVRELRDGKPWGHWRRLHQTPRGKYYLMNAKQQRENYDGPDPMEPRGT